MQLRIASEVRTVQFYCRRLAHSTRDVVKPWEVRFSEAGVTTSESLAGSTTWRWGFSVRSRGGWFAARCRTRHELGAERLRE
jgi:hypothetical protein